MRSLDDLRPDHRGEVISGLCYQIGSLAEISAQIAGWVGSERRGHRASWFACVNPYSSELARLDPAFRAALRDADLRCADGVGIIIASILLRGRMRERVCGPDLFPRVSALLNERERPIRVCFLGGTEDALRKIETNYRKDYPRIQVVGCLAPPLFREVSTELVDSCAEWIRNSQAEMVWIGLGAPKQEKLCLQLSGRLPGVVLAPIGAVFDFYAGRISLPPPWLQRIGLIWLYRLVQEPGRLWKRNFHGIIFMGRVIIDSVRRIMLTRRGSRGAG
jgi:N-acetylglucosaminyldiphosphoundecaprenol N-acetyl-beta-D-mannosaminyltransferase